jgi:predicted Rossmann-fold nucleotide-binding protein
MTGKRTKRIIAVFGGSQDTAVLDFAERLGHIIAEEKQILLTGGTGPAKGDVKNAAILGAGSSPWIGVDRRKPDEVRRLGPGAKWSKKPEWGFRIRSDLNHKRNYLEALMCDAAIALKGKGGTLSEVASALSLQRPVAFVGDSWKGLYSLLHADRSQAINLLVGATLNKFKSLGSDALASRSSPERIRGGLSGLLHYTYFDSQATAKAVVGWITSVLPDSEGFAGEFPSINGHEKVAEEYRKWLTEYGV